MTTETEGKKALFDWRISMGNVLVVIGMVVSGFWYFADADKTNALQDVQIAAEQQARKEAILAEQQARREALQDLRIRIDADRAEMRAQFEKINDKLDALVKSRGQ